MPAVLAAAAILSLTAASEATLAWALPPAMVTLPKLASL